MRILYGVSGEGSGHAMRAREVMRHFQELGHDIQVVTYGRGLEILTPEFPCTSVSGNHMSYKANSIRYLRTVGYNVMRAPAIAKSRSRVGQLLHDWQPHLVCTDFEPISAHMARRLHIPILSIDNIHQVLYRRDTTPWQFVHNEVIAKAIIRMMIRRADAFVVTSLDGTAKVAPQVIATYPVVRRACFVATPVSGDHVVVYDSFTNKKLPNILSRLPHRFRLYGHLREETVGNIEFRRFHEQRFLDDLVTARAVIGTGGFTLISESLVLKKPYLATPVGGHFEQIANALFLESNGYGALCRTLNRQTILSFLDNLPAYAEQLATYHHPGREAVFGDIDRVMSTLTVNR